MTTNLLNIGKSPLVTFVKGFFRKPTKPVQPVAVNGSTDEDATRTITVQVLRPYTDRILYAFSVRCPVSAAPARIAQRVAVLKKIPGNHRVWMTDTRYGVVDPAATVGVNGIYDYRYRVLRQDNTVGVRLIDPRRR